MNTVNLQEVPLDQIVPNPDQPRRYISPESIQSMADSLKEIGQQTPIKVVRVSPQGALSGKTQYMLIGGHRRFEGAKAAGLTSLNAIVQTLTPDEADLATFMDNQSEDMTWLDTDLAIARIVTKTGSDQRTIAKQLSVSLTKVNNAVKIANALTPAAVDMLDQDLQKSLNFDVQQLNTKNKVFLITERIVLSLADLNDPAKVEQALKVVMDELMTEPETKKLVEWVKAGNLASSFSPAHHVAPKQKAQPEIATSQPDPIGSAPRNDSEANPTADPPKEKVWYWFKRIWMEIWQGLQSKFHKQLVQVGVVMIWVVGIGIATSLVGFLAHARWASLWDITREVETTQIATPAVTTVPTAIPSPVVEASAPTVVSHVDVQPIVAVPSPTVVSTQAVDISEATLDRPEKVKPKHAQEKAAKVVTKPERTIAKVTPVATKSEDLVEKVVDKAAPAAAEGLVKSLF